MKTLELFEKYPKAAEIVLTHYRDTFLKSIEESDAPEEFKEYARQQQVDEGAVAEIIENNARGTFDIFDENGIYIQIGVYPDKTFNCTINELGTTSFFATRKEAEAYAVEAAFEILNEKLCQTK